MPSSATLQSTQSTSQADQVRPTSAPGGYPLPGTGSLINMAMNQAGMDPVGPTATNQPPRDPAPPSPTDLSAAGRSTPVDIPPVTDSVSVNPGEFNLSAMSSFNTSGMTQYVSNTPAQGSSQRTSLNTPTFNPDCDDEAGDL